jgi:hypothetical protein
LTTPTATPAHPSKTIDALRAEMDLFNIRRYLLAEANIRSERDHYTLWAYCRDSFVYGYHIVRRRRDDALGVEHFYYPRFAGRES